MNFYNEIDDYCCDWLENLIRERLIPDGVVDRRSIVDILPADLNGFTQCHFFAGLGGWPLALRRAAYPDHRKVWTGSCPCQPFSAAGKRLGFADDRHLWPYWRYLIAVRRPPIVLGEQVASAADWIRLVRGDLEALDYPVGIMPVEAASAGADHLRDRFWFVAHDEHAGEGRGRLFGPGESASAAGEWAPGQPAGSGHNGVAQGDARGARLAVRPLATEFGRTVWHEGTPAGAAGDRSAAVDMAHGNGERLAQRPQRPQRPQQHERAERSGQQTPFGHDPLRSGFRTTFVLSDTVGTRIRSEGPKASAGTARGVQGADEQREWIRPDAGPVRVPEFEWVLGADGKARRVKSGIRLLAHGVPARVAKLRALGNAIDPRPAAAFIRAAVDY